MKIIKTIKAWRWDVRGVLGILVSCVLITFDQWIKHMVRLGVPYGESFPVIGQFLHITYVENTGGAWSILQGHTWFFLTIAAVLSVVALVTLLTKTHWMVRLAMALILAGGLGNAVDRIRLGAVVDFIECHFGSYVFPVFNFADMCICCGAVALGIYVVFIEQRLQREET